VRADLAAWSRNDVDEVMSHFAEDATFDIGPSPSSPAAPALTWRFVISRWTATWCS